MRILNILFKRWFWSTNHKDIETLYLIFGGFAGIVGIFLLVLIRCELFKPWNQALFFVGFIGIMQLFDYFILINLLTVTHLVSTTTINQCSKIIIDKISKEQRKCRNYVWKKSKNFLCFVHEKQNEVPEVVIPACQGIILNKWTKGIIEFCTRNVHNGGKFCGFHRNFRSSILFTSFMHSSFTISLNRILILKEVFFRLSIHKTILEAHQIYYRNLYLYLTACLSYLNRLDLGKFKYLERITWNYFGFPLGHLDPSSITILKLPISIVKLLIADGYLVVLDNSILKLLFFHFRVRHAGFLFYENFPMLFQILCGNFNMELQFFFRSLDLNLKNKFKDVFRSKLKGNLSDISWNDIIRHLMSHGLSKLKFLKNLVTSHLRFWTILKTSCLEINKLKRFIWTKRVTETYLNYFQKFQITNEFRQTQLIGRLQTYFILFIVNDVFINLVTKIRVWLGFPNWFHFVQLGHLWINSGTTFSVESLNLYLSRFFLINPEKPLFIFNLIDLDNSSFVNFLSEYFRITFENNYSQESFFYLKYKFEEDWLKNLVLNSENLPILNDFQVDVLNSEKNSKFWKLSDFFKNDLRVSINLFRDVLNKVLIKRQLFLELSIKKKKFYLSSLGFLAEKRESLDFKIFSYVRDSITFRLSFYLNHEYRNFLTNNLKKKSFYGYLYSFLKKSLDIISNKFLVVSTILSKLNINDFISNFIKWFLNKKNAPFNLVKNLVKDFKLNRNTLQVRWIILNPLLQKIIGDQLGVFLIRKMIFFLFLKKNLCQDLKKIRLWLSCHFEDEVFLENNYLLSTYLKLVSKFILCLVHAKIISQRGLNFEKTIHKHRIKSWEIFPNTKGVTIDKNSISLPNISTNDLNLKEVRNTNKNEKFLMNPPRDGRIILNKLSSEALISINSLQKATFKINTIYLKLLKKWDKLYSGLAWPTKRDYSNQLKTLKKWVNKIPHLKWKLKSFFYLKKKYKHLTDFDTLVCSYLNLSNIEFNLILNFEKELNILKDFLIRRKFFLKTLKLASYLIGYNLSFRVFLDYRCRMYYLFSLGIGPGTANFLKRLLNSSTNLKLDFNSFFYVLRAYYSNKDLILKKLDNFVLDLEIRKICTNQRLMFLINFFYCNSTSLSGLSLSEALMQKEITALIRSKKFSSSIMLTVDQKSSSLVFFSILFRDTLLARKCNLITKNPNDVYLFFQNNLIKWLKLKNRKFNKSLKLLIKLFKKHRVLIKNAIMKFFYSQKWNVRLNEWSREIKKILNLSFLNFGFYQEMKWISINFESFIRFVFPSLVHNLNLLKKIFRLSVKLNNQICFRSIDNCKISYKFLHVNSKSIKIWDQKKKKYISVRMNSISSEFTTKVINRYMRSVIPNLLHFIDSSVLRIVISRLKKKIPIDHLQMITQHDSFTINAALLPLLYEELESFYKKSSDQEWIREIVINPIKDNMKNLCDKKKVENLFSKFIFGKKWSGRYFDIRNLYPPELK